MGTLHKCRVFSPENRDVLVHKATGYSAKLLKKADQCRAVCTCSHLFWQEEVSLPLHCILSAISNSNIADYLFLNEKAETICSIAPYWLNVIQINLEVAEAVACPQTDILCTQGQQCRDLFDLFAVLLA